MKALTLNFKTAQTDLQSLIKFPLKILKNIFSTFYENTRSVVTSRHDHLFLRSIQEMKALTLNFKMTQTGFESPIKFPLKFLKKMLSRPNAKHTKRHNFSPRPSSHEIFHETKALNPPLFYEPHNSRAQRVSCVGVAKSETTKACAATNDNNKEAHRGRRHQGRA